MKLKNEIRKSIIRKRLTLPREDIQQRSGIIAKKIIESNLFAQIMKNVCLYLPIKNEVETKDIINYLIEAKAHIYLPKYFEWEKLYKLTEFDNWEDLEIDPNGIMQPISKKVIDSKDIDLVIFPGVGFDKKGVRLGYGKGVYDKLFAKSNATLVGLAYEFQILDELPRENHDLVMNFAITDEKVYRF